MPEMCNAGGPGGPVLVIWQLTFSCSLANDLRDLAVMDMADIRENMVLHLMVESPGKPVHDLVSG